jgi:ATP-dependent DNA helicase RecG
MSPPTFRDSVAAFTVAFPNHSLLSDEIIRWIEALGEQGLTESQVIGLAMLKEGSDLDNASYRSATGVDSRRAYAELRDLTIRELVDQVGDKRWARYVLKEGLAPTDRSHLGPATRRRKPADRRQEILSALGTATMSRAELVAATGLSDGIVGRWLKVLKSEGAVRVAGDVDLRSKHTKYIR